MRTSTATTRRAVTEAGGIVTGWLFQLVVIMAVLAFLGYEAISIGLNAVNVEDSAQETARAAARSYREDQRIDTAREAAEQQAAAEGVVLVDVSVEGDRLSVVVRRTANTLIVHEVGALEDIVTRQGTSTVNWRPS